MFKNIIVFAALELCFQLAFSQQKEKQILTTGDTLPSIEFRAVEYFSTTSLNLRDFRGKWLVITFWSENCPTCFHTFPKSNELQQKYPGKMQFLMVGITGHGYNKESTREVFESYRSSLHLQLPVFYDSTLFNMFGAGGCPFIVIADPTGIVRAITGYFTKDDAIDLMSGGHPRLLPAVYDPSIRTQLVPLTVLTSGESTRHSVDENANLSNSSISEWHRPTPAAIPPLKFDTADSLVFRGTDLNDLYRYAYTGIYWWEGVGDTLYSNWGFRPVLQIKDTALFQGDFLAEKHMFSYQRTFDHPVSKTWLLECLRSDLRCYFHYDVKIEKRNLPYLSLTVALGAADKLLAKSGEQCSWHHLKSGTQFLGFTATNITPNMLLSLIEKGNQPHSGGLPFIDETNINGGIDITVNALLTDIPSLTKELAKSGLILAEKKREMNVLVIREIE